jgi:hypothetical protein
LRGWHPPDCPLSLSGAFVKFHARHASRSEKTPLISIGMLQTAPYTFHIAIQK